MWAFRPKLLTTQIKTLESATYSVKEGKEMAWYCWDIMEVKVEPVKQYGVKYPELEKERVEDMERRARECLDEIRIQRGEGLSAEEIEREREMKERLEVVEGSDLEEEGMMGRDE